MLWKSNQTFTNRIQKQKFVREARYIMQFIHPGLAEMKSFSFRDADGKEVPSVVYKQKGDGISLASVLSEKN